MTSTSSLYRFVQCALSPWVRRYARLEVIGLENLPPVGQGALLACNHSGSFWWDALCLIAGVNDRPVHFVAHHWDAKIRWMRRVLEHLECGFLDEACGDIDSHGSVVNLAASGKLLCIYPEESYHSFRHRYTLFRFSPHVCKYAHLADVPIVPVTIIGAEEAAATFFGPKCKQVPLHFPLHPPMILPFKVTIVIGEPVRTEALLNRECEGSALTDHTYGVAAQALRELMFATMGKYRSCKLSDEAYIERCAWY